MYKTMFAFIVLSALCVRATCQQWEAAIQAYPTERQLDAPNQHISFAAFPEGAAVAMVREETSRDGGFPCSFAGERPCWSEKPVQDAAGRAFLASDAILEVSTGSGVTSCFLAAATRNSGNVVVAVPEGNASLAMLANRHSHECSFWMVRSLEFTIDGIEAATGLGVNALLINCDGCIHHILPDDPTHALRNIRAIVVEADMACPGPSPCVDYADWTRKLRRAGFSLVETVPGANIPWVDMLTFIRPRSRRCVADADCAPSKRDLTINVLRGGV